MKSLLGKIFTVAVLICLCGSIASAKTYRVSFGPEPYPPFYQADAAGNWTGWEIEIIDAICKAAKIDYVLKPVAWDGLIPALKSNKIDMIMGSMSVTAKRLKMIDFSDKYYNTPTAIVGSKQVKMDATPEGLKGKIIGVQIGTVHQTYALKHFKDAKIKEYQTQDEINQDVVSGRLDGTQADAIAMEAFLATEDGKKYCEFKGNVKDDPEVLGLGVGVGMRKGEDELKAKINEAIKTIRANGKFQEITAKYFNFDVYGD